MTCSGSIRTLLAASGCAGVWFFARPARAVDLFEIQVYDGTANTPGSPGLELHINRVFAGIGTAESPELPPRHQSHFTLEPSYGLLEWWELGGYFQTALRADGTFDYAGIKLRSKFVTPPNFLAHARFGVNIELSMVPERYDRNRYGTELRPIAAWEDARWLLALNPILGIAYAGGQLNDGPDFEPALMAKIKIGKLVALGIEYYAALGPISHPLSFRDQEHYLFESIDVLGVQDVEVNVGLGEGLTGASNAWTAKLILGFSWESQAPDGRRDRLDEGSRCIPHEQPCLSRRSSTSIAVLLPNVATNLQ